MAYSEAKKAANQRWDRKNKERVNYIQYRSKARNFIKNEATLKDVAEFQELLSARMQELIAENESK
ncbi:hypothetical protein C5Z26_09145 [Lactobacillus sp. CBA3606]|uniref:hypothetical protein n=1 Tax=Lactobacillus sp. CBA3606 TaxID=2099789 RepID=UPI000CFB5484|nr:hypothetical protein [Lactobacillus sp. CBA3606]AVK64266.1 hypothetical protein C5Z26_09145 [Lactobacillus sp. CBA3606]